MNSILNIDGHFKVVVLRHDKLVSAAVVRTFAASANGYD